MPHGRSQSTASGARAGKGAANSSSGGGVLSRVLGSLRRYSEQGDATANNKEDTAWIDNYKITHRPDRPRRDKREGLQCRNSADVLGQLNRIWRHNRRMLEEKKRQRAARERALAAEFARLNAQDEMDQDKQRSQQRDTEIDHNSQLPSPQHDAMPNFSRKATLPDFTKSEWRPKSRDHHGRSTYAPSSSSTISDRMTIKVGLEVQKTEERAKSGGFRMSSEGIRTRGQQEYENDTLPLLPPRSFAPSTAPPQRPVSASISSPTPKGPVRKRHTRSLSRTPSQRTPLPNTMQAPSARSKALRQNLYINTDQESTPSLVHHSSPVSEQLSPLTPIEDVCDDKVGHRKFPSTKPRGTKTCPVPLCGRPLVTKTDRQHNLCADCRSELQPRQSIFTSDVINPFPRSYSPPNAEFSTHPPLIPDDEYDSTAESVEAASPKEMLKPTRCSKGASKTRGVKRGGDQLHDNTRAVEKTEPPSSKVIIHNRHVVSRFNKGRGEFKLQSVPASRKHAHRKRELQHGNPGAERQTSRQTSARHSRDGNDGNHISFQLAGWRTPAPSPTPPRPPSHRTVNSRPRQASGPLLEPKTFRPAPPPARQNKTNETAHRRTSDSRQRANEGNPIGSGRRLSWLLDMRDGNTAVHSGHIPSNAPLISTGDNRGKHQSDPQHRKHRVSELAGKGTSTQATRARSNLETGKKKKVEDDIYREIDSIIDCYLRLPDTPELENKKRKEAAIASYYSGVPLDVQMKIKGFF
ncbi:hypothetical protein F5Y07DRAFT_11120 [Xylaria sp. FL0933]|nr:hypothetical protein F5Y07DRAFT_11120 [Xylaria sp. FL0933]